MSDDVSTSSTSAQSGSKLDLDATFSSLDLQLNSSKTPLAQRFRALFTLKGLGGLRAIEIIGKGWSHAFGCDAGAESVFFR